ncbi:hypothetical protein HDU93_009273 [Gonapodya sp. JEL0774]|nr:hypothetical protein HDU93_009273 [Gonapodya sp. JEL0774]
MAQMERLEDQNGRTEGMDVDVHANELVEREGGEWTWKRDREDDLEGVIRNELGKRRRVGETEEEAFGEMGSVDTPTNAKTPRGQERPQCSGGASETMVERMDCTDVGVDQPEFPVEMLTDMDAVRVELEVVDEYPHELPEQELIHDMQIIDFCAGNQFYIGSILLSLTISSTNLGTRQHSLGSRPTTFKLAIVFSDRNGAIPARFHLVRKDTRQVVVSAPVPTTTSPAPGRPLLPTPESYLLALYEARLFIATVPDLVATFTMRDVTLTSNVNENGSGGVSLGTHGGGVGDERTADRTWIDNFSTFRLDLHIPLFIPVSLLPTLSPTSVHATRTLHSPLTTLLNFLHPPPLLSRASLARDPTAALHAACLPRVTEDEDWDWDVDINTRASHPDHDEGEQVDTQMEPFPPQDLVCHLMPYQQRELRWMMAREGVPVHLPRRTGRLADTDRASTALVAHCAPRVPPYVSFSASLQTSFSFHRLTGAVYPTSFQPSDEESENQNPLIQARRLNGGVVASEMGLGKTVQVIALVLAHPWRPRANPADAEEFSKLASARRKGKGKAHTKNPAAFVPQLAALQPPFTPDDTLPFCPSTLVVCPPTLAAQWLSEIHTHAPGLAVAEYRGVGVDMVAYPVPDADEDEDNAEKVEPVTMPATPEVLARFAIVMTTYDVLKRDVHYARAWNAPKKDLRTRKATKITPSPKQTQAPDQQRGGTPLVAVRWWRVVLDEAQEVEGGAKMGAEMAGRVPWVNGWAVSGTPTGKSGTADLLGLITFLRPPALTHPAVIRRLLRSDPPHPALLVHFMSTILRRTTKLSVKDELVIPRQRERVVKVSMSKVEGAWYEGLWERAAREVGGGGDGHGGYRLGGVDEKSDKDWAKMRTWLLRLRQACCHPQVGDSNRRDLGGGGVKSMFEVLEHMYRTATANVHTLDRQCVAVVVRRAQAWEKGWEKDGGCDKSVEAYKKLLPAVQARVHESRREIADLEKRKAAQVRDQKNGPHQQPRANLSSPVAAVMAADIDRTDEEESGDEVDNELVIPGGHGIRTSGTSNSRKRRGLGKNLPGTATTVLFDKALDPNEDHLAQLKMRLQHWLEALHRCQFFLASAYVTMGDVAKEEEWYEKAQETRNLMLKDKMARVEKWRKKIARAIERRKKGEADEHDKDGAAILIGNGNIVQELDLGIRPIQVPSYLAQNRTITGANTTIGILNAQWDLIRGWRDRILRILTADLEVRNYDGDYRTLVDTIGRVDLTVEPGKRAPKAKDVHVYAPAFATFAQNKDSGSGSDAGTPKPEERQTAHAVTKTGLQIGENFSPGLSGVLATANGEPVEQQSDPSPASEELSASVPAVMAPTAADEKPTGNEYDAGLALQEECFVYQNTYLQSFPERRILLTGLSLVRQRFAEPNNDLGRDLREALWKLRCSKPREESMAAALQALKVTIEKSNFLNETDQDVLREEVERLKTDCDKQLKAVEWLEKESVSFTQLANSRVEYYRHLQSISDSVDALVLPDRCLGDDEALRIECEKLVQRTYEDEADLRKKIAQAEGKLRYLATLLQEEGITVNAGSGSIQARISSSGEVMGIESEALLEQNNSKPTPSSSPGASKAAHELFSGLSKTEVHGDDPLLPLDRMAALRINGSFGAKLDHLVKHLLCLPQADKCLIFSQWDEVLSILTVALTHNEIKFVRIDGSRKNKLDAITKFREDPQIKCFMLHARSQSSGLTLVQARHVFLVEPVIDPGLELQAVNRVHRYGQKQETYVWRYIVAGTVEERVYAIHAERLKALRHGHSDIGHSQDAVGGGSTDDPADLDAMEAEGVVEEAYGNVRQRALAGKKEGGGGEWVADEDLAHIFFE